MLIAWRSGWMLFTCFLLAQTVSWICNRYQHIFQIPLVKELRSKEMADITKGSETISGYQN